MCGITGKIYFDTKKIPINAYKIVHDHFDWRNYSEILRPVRVELSRQLKINFFFLEPFVVFFISF